MLRRGSALLLGLAACSSQALPPDSPIRDANPPTLEVRSPARGTMVSGQQLVVVAGKVSDDESGVQSVMVNDVATQLDADGSWKVTLPVAPGMNLLHTVAADKAGNKVTDTRAVMGGNLVRTDTPVQNAFSA